MSERVEKAVEISQEEVKKQFQFCREIYEQLQHSPQEKRLAFVDTYGCQQNEADSQKLRGYLLKMGYKFTDDTEKAQMIVINTCAIRDHAEQKVLGNVGALVHGKRRNPGQMICLCGCMMQQKHVADKIKKSFRHVDLVFGPQVLWKFPEFVHQLYTAKGRIFEIPEGGDSIVEGIPQVRRDGIKAMVSIMYGCNNFCTYCIVPYVRGRERSRKPEDVIAEVKQLAEEGYKEVTLLGQNVNSYGKDLEIPRDFSDLLRQINQVEGDFILRFMTSHPKDATDKLFQTMAECDKIPPSLHLPFQSGSNAVLKSMNRGYTREKYIEEIRQVRARIPEITVTSDVIVGFPGETTEQFEETLSLLKEVEFDGLYTFIFSARNGTPAAEMEDPVPLEEKKRNFQRLLDTQNEISAQKHRKAVGEVMRVLVDGVSGDSRFNLSARTPGNRLIRLSGEESLVGTFQKVKVISNTTWALEGELMDKS